MKYFGNLFRNKKKEGGSDNQPIYKGDATINGVKYEMAGWLKQTKNGDTYLGLNFTVADEQGSPEKWKTKQNVPGLTPALDDDIPF